VRDGQLGNHLFFVMEAVDKHGSVYQILGEILARGWGNLVARMAGPLNFRFIVQPVVAATLAVRAGIRDNRTGQPAFLWSWVTSRGCRRTLLLDGVKDTSKVFIFAIVLDCIYQDLG